MYVGERFPGRPRNLESLYDRCSMISDPSCGFFLTCGGCSINSIGRLGSMKLYASWGSSRFCLRILFLCLELAYFRQGFAKNMFNLQLCTSTLGALWTSILLPVSTVRVKDIKFQRPQSPHENDEALSARKLLHLGHKKTKLDPCSLEPWTECCRFDTYSTNA